MKRFCLAFQQLFLLNNIIITLNLGVGNCNVTNLSNQQDLHHVHQKDRKKTTSFINMISIHNKVTTCQRTKLSAPMRKRRRSKASLEGSSRRPNHIFSEDIKKVEYQGLSMCISFFSFVLCCLHSLLPNIPE